MIDISKLQAERVRIEAWRVANIDKLGTPEFRRSTLTHRLLTDLIRRRGGSAADRAYVERELIAIQQGERDADQ
jgi:hypothetical protein